MGTGSGLSDVVGRIANTGLFPATTPFYGNMSMLSNNSLELSSPQLNLAVSKRMPQVFPTDYRIVATALHVTIFLLGFWGNILLLIVVHRTKSLHNPTYCYLISLAWADLVALVSAVPEAIVSYHLYGRQWILGQVGCSLLVFGNFLGINAGSLSITAFSVERYVVICHPLWAQKICTIERAKRIIAAIWIFCTVYSAPWLGLTKTQPYPRFPEMETCELRLSRRTYMFIFSFDLAVFYVIPLLAATVFYVKIIIALHRRNRQTELDGARRKSSASIFSNVSWGRRPTSSDWSRDGFEYSASRRASNVRRNSLDPGNVQVLKMLAVVVFSFAASWLPYRGLLVYNIFAERDWLNIWYMLFAKSAIFVNCSMNPFLYNAMSKRFRKAFIKTIYCRNRRKSIASVPNQKSLRSIFRQFGRTKSWLIWRALLHFKMERGRVYVWVPTVSLKLSGDLGLLVRVLWNVLTVAVAALKGLARQSGVKKDHRFSRWKTVDVPARSSFLSVT